MRTLIVLCALALVAPLAAANPAEISDDELAGGHTPVEAPLAVSRTPDDFGSASETEMAPTAAPALRYEIAPAPMEASTAPSAAPERRFLTWSGRNPVSLRRDEGELILRAASDNHIALRR